MKNRSIAVAIILTLITCGIYGIYWIAVVNNDINTITGHPEDTSGGMVVLLSIVTCGIYALYWNYKMGAKIDEMNGGSSSNAIVFLLLSIFGLSIVGIALMQDFVNKNI